MTTTNGTLLAVDSRGRVTLGQLATHGRYLAHTEPDGTIVLTPAAVMPEAQARFMADPDRARLLTDPTARSEMEPAPDWFRQIIDKVHVDPDGTVRITANERDTV